ncbi:hypothetical protein [Rugosimonospora africana]|uniref:Uncharacterized protein n=1 Tax=Rugosimonospora africana TaxID=556532 RepID=A0A8J3R3W5_9ACTN|nr:hypothetical protein [Rugosimonospora africana]GIH21248.1 hypothetical protein Raf01_94200 [Rugosimonospora africana]
MADIPSDRPPRRDPDANPDNVPHNKDNDHLLPNLDFLKKLPGDTSLVTRTRESDSGRESDPPAHPSGSPESDRLPTTPPGGGSAGGPSPHDVGEHRLGYRDGGGDGDRAGGSDAAGVGVGADHADGSVGVPPVEPAGRAGADGPGTPAGQADGSGRATGNADQAGGAEQITIGSTARDGESHRDAGPHAWAPGSRSADPPPPSNAGRSGSAPARDGRPAVAAAPTPRQDARPDRAGAGSVDATVLGGAGTAATTTPETRTPEQRVPTDAVPPEGASGADTSHLLLAFNLPTDNASPRTGTPAGDAVPAAEGVSPSEKAKDGQSSTRADTATGPREKQPPPRAVGRSEPAPSTPAPSMPAPRSVANPPNMDLRQSGGDPAGQRSMSEHLDGATPERLPAAANAWHGIGIEDVVRERLPHTDGTPSGHDVRAPDGSYVLKPQVLHTAEGDRVAYYNAWNPHSHRVEFAVGPGDVDTFLDGCNVKLNVPFSDRTVNAWQMNAGSYFGVTGANTEWQRQSAQVVDSMMRGDWVGAARHFARSYAEAAEDPGWWLTVADATLAPGAAGAGGTAGRTAAGREAGGLAGAAGEAGAHPPAPAAKPTPAAEARPDPARGPVPGAAPTPAKGDGAGARYEPPSPGSGGERPGSSGQSGDHPVSSSDRTWARHDNPRSQWNGSPHLAGDRRAASPAERHDRTPPAHGEGSPGPLAGADDAEIDKAIEGMTSPRTTGGSRPRIDGHPVPTSKRDRVDIQDVPRLPGETQREALARVHQVVGRDVSTYGEVRAAWNRARDHVTSTEPLARHNYVKLYDRTRERFWQEIRADPAARERFEKAGFRFSDTNPRSAPMLDSTRIGPSPTERRLSLDHKAEKAIGENWRLALDSDNLRFELQMPNTYREIVQMRHPELRESADDDSPTR